MRDNTSLWHEKKVALVEEFRRRLEIAIRKGDAFIASVYARLIVAAYTGSHKI